MPIAASSLTRLVSRTTPIKPTATKPNYTAPMAKGIPAMHARTTPGGTACETASPMSDQPIRTSQQESTAHTAAATTVTARAHCMKMKSKGSSRNSKYAPSGDPFRFMRSRQKARTAGLQDRFSESHHSPSKTIAELEEKVVQSPQDLRSGPARIAAATGGQERTVSRILRCHQIPHLACCAPLTGEVIRASRATTARYERERPGELVHIDVKKPGRIPGPWHRLRLRPCGH